MDVIILWMSKKDHMMCSIRELHRDLYDDKMGLAEAIDAIDGKELISDTRLRSLIPPFFKPMTESMRQVCGCEMCIIIERHQTCLNEFRRRQLKKLEAATMLNVEFLLCLLAPQNARVICKSTQKNAALADTKVAARWPLFQEETVGQIRLTLLLLRAAACCCHAHLHVHVAR